MSLKNKMLWFNVFSFYSDIDTEIDKWNKHLQTSQECSPVELYFELFSQHYKYSTHKFTLKEIYTRNLPI